MEDVIWEIRFLDGRGASWFTAIDLTNDIGKRGVVRTVPVAASVFKESQLSDARSCIDRGAVVQLVANMEAVAYLVRHSVGP